MSEARHSEASSPDGERTILPSELIAETRIVKVFSVGGLADQDGQYIATLGVYKRIYGEGAVFLADYEVDGVVQTGVALTDPEATPIIPIEEAATLMLLSP